MFPKLFDLGPVSVYTYGVLLAAAYLIGLQFARMRAARRGLDATAVMDLGVLIIIAALLGAKLMLVVVDFDVYRQSPRELLTLVRAGGVFYGGLIAAVAAAFWFMRRRKMPVWTTTDVFAPAIALGHAVGRLGCLMAGCCYGRPTSVPWAVTFTDPLAATNVGTPLHTPLHPTQIYESAAEFLILGFLLVFERRGKPFPGRTFWSYMLLYAVSRFVIEFYRGDNRGMLGAFSTSQVISLALLPVSVVMLVRLSRRPGEQAAPARQRARA
jgi:phosphatidylglycerol:prolipoprotein diacylglycerol transferase